MKKIGILTLLATVLLAVGCHRGKNGAEGAPSAESGSYTVSWNLQGVMVSENVIDSVTYSVNGKHVQTLTGVKNGIYEFKGEAEMGDVACLTAYINHSEIVTSVLMALEKGDIGIDNDSQSAMGTPTNDEVTDFVSKQVNGQGSSAECAAYITQHAADLRSLLVVGNEAFRSMVPPAEMRHLFGSLKPELRNSAYGKNIKAAIDKSCATLEGAKFVDFAATHNGKTQHLSDYVGKGKLVVADFWASWCGPCRKEIPNLINIYNKYGQRVTVLGVATWDEPEETEKAIAELKIPYPQMINAQNAGSDAYSITGIPEIIVFAPDGTILHRGLRGKALEKAVADFLKNSTK